MRATIWVKMVIIDVRERTNAGHGVSLIGVFGSSKSTTACIDTFANFNALADWTETLPPYQPLTVIPRSRSGLYGQTDTALYIPRPRLCLKLLCQFAAVLLELIILIQCSFYKKDTICYFKNAIQIHYYWDSNPLLLFKIL